MPVLTPSNSSVTAVPREVQTRSAWPERNQGSCMVITEEFDGLTIDILFQLPFVVGFRLSPAGMSF